MGEEISSHFSSIETDQAAVPATHNDHRSATRLPSTSRPWISSQYTASPPPLIRSKRGLLRTWTYKSRHGRLLIITPSQNRPFALSGFVAFSRQALRNHPQDSHRGVPTSWTFPPLQNRPQRLLWLALLRKHQPRTLSSYRYLRLTSSFRLRPMASPPRGISVLEIYSMPARPWWGR